MKLVLAEDRSGQLHGERAFTGDKILVGRDPAACQYFFSQEQWPMVSRKHAEFHLGQGRCMVADNNSSFGTFVNGQKISGPVEVSVGAHIQLGAGGPILRVVSIEQSPAAEGQPKESPREHMETIRDPGFTPPVISPAPKPEPRKPPAAPPPPPPARTAPARLDLIDSRTGQTRRIEI